MKKQLYFFLLAFMASSITAFCQNSSPFIHIDQFGYPPNATKVAVISNPQQGYNASDSYNAGDLIELRNSNSDAVVFASNPQIWNNGNTHSQSGDQGWWFDFSTIQTPGTYYIYDPSSGERSGDFAIGETVYQEVLKAAGRMYFYNRCNMEKANPYAEQGFTDGTSFLGALQDANCRYIYDPENSSLEKDLSGGWFDAGDYNKYVTFAVSAVHNLLAAYEENPDAFTDDWNIPESGNGLPDILDEIKWELDWLMKMNNDDGSTHIKMGSRSFGENENSPPSNNFDRRYYGPICSAASIAVAGMFAHAASVYEDFPAYTAYAQSLSSDAITTWNYVLPALQSNSLDVACDDGSIVAGDADWDVVAQKEQALAAAIYLFDLTGDAAYNTYVSANIQDAEPVTANFWGPYKFPLNDALLLYTVLPGANSAAVDAILQSIQFDVSNNWNGYYGFNSDDLYRAFMPDWSYHWGSNSPKANYGVLNKLLVRYQINSGADAAYDQKAQEQLHYFHGVNPQGMVQLSNMYQFGGDRCVNEIYHAWFADGTSFDHALNSAIGPAPGFVTGGANPDFSITSISPPAGQPAQKAYLDFNTSWPDNSWEISEPAIYYQAAYLRLLAWFTKVDTDPVSSTANEPVLESLKVFPNPSKGIIYVQSEQRNGRFEVWNNMGSLLKTVPISGGQLEIDLKGLSPGAYLLKRVTAEGVVNGVQRVLKINAY